MKQVVILAFAALIWSLLSSVAVSSSSTDEFGNRIFQAIQQNDFEAIKKMMVSTEDIANTLDHFEMDANRREKVKASLTEKVSTDMDKTVQQIETGFKEIRTVFESKKCKKDIGVSKITPKTSVVKGLPFEIGDLEIEFNCGNSSEKMNVEIIKTETGWYILEKLRLIHE